MQSGWISYYYLGGTSMASPHVTGIVALMLQKDLGLIAFEAEAIPEATVIWMPAWSPDADGAGLITADAALGL